MTSLATGLSTQGLLTTATPTLALKLSNIVPFVAERYKNCDFYQPNLVKKYPGLDYEFTRIVEYRHFLNQPSDHTMKVKEYGQDGGEPYYPILDDCNKQLYQTYRQRAEADEGVLV